MTPGPLDTSGEVPSPPKLCLCIELGDLWITLSLSLSKNYYCDGVQHRNRSWFFYSQFGLFMMSGHQAELPSFFSSEKYKYSRWPLQITAKGPFASGFLQVQTGRPYGNLQPVSSTISPLCIPFTPSCIKYLQLFPYQSTDFYSSNPFLLHMGVCYHNLLKISEFWVFLRKFLFLRPAKEDKLWKWSNLLNYYWSHI